ncbi:MAG: alpha/beta hydrolase [Pararhodobacter sp.]|nr:alpha/beta hydrolase [Pararhodobacter sp.]
MPPLVFLPGLLCTPAACEQTFKHLAMACAEAVALPDSDDFAAIAEKLAAQLPERCILAGHSMGSYLCLEIWRRRPERIAGMALISCTPRADTPEAATGRQKAVAWAAKAGMTALAGVIADQMLGAARRNDAALRAQIADMAETVGHATFARHQTALAARPDNSELLARIDCPVLAVTGSEDSVTPPETARALAAALPRGRHVEIPCAGHLLPLEAPKALAEAIAGLVAECARHEETAP